MRIKNGRIEGRLWELAIWVGLFVLIAVQLLESIRVHHHSTTSTNDLQASKEHHSFAAPLATMDSAATSLQPPSFFSNSTDNNDWFDAALWTSNPMTNSCTYVEDICHSNHHWFYNSKADSHQPYPLRLKLRWLPGANYVPIETLPLGFPDTISIYPKFPSNKLQCSYSPIPNHMSLHAYSNHMLGEFYARVLMGLWDIVNVIKKYPHLKNTTDLAFETQTQLYLHFQEGRKVVQLLESHHLLLDLVTHNPVLQFRKLLDNTHCRCLKRLLLCGYDRQDASTLRPARNVGIINHAEHSGKKSYSMAKHSMRQAMLENLMDKNPLMQQMIEAYRLKVLFKANAIKQHVNNTSDYKIIGLAQRTKRRKWKDLNKLILYCNHKYKALKIVCVEVNIEEEEWSNAVSHVIAHGGLDALIGIHGATLTEALLMPRAGSLVVELLPWIHPEQKWGSWTKWVHRPTPLGVLFTETNLNHIGYPLQRQHSVDACHGVDFTRQCYSKDQHRWDNRDFWIEPELLDDIFQKFVIQFPTECDELERAAGNDYVLYNVNCIPMGQAHKEAKHYYRPKDWIVTKEKEAQNNTK